jgi:hypothetical protein
MSKEFYPDGFCGLYCASCAVYIATKTNTREKLAKESGIPYDQTICYGCKSDINPKWCVECKLKLCAKEKKVDFCFQCDEYPCKNLEDFKNDPKYPYHCEIYEYMETIKKEGKEKWLKKMRSRWTCADCNKPSSWFETSCSQCGLPLKGYKKP